MLKNYRVDEDFRGCILVENKEEVLYKHCSGYADLPNMIDLNLDTRFGTASAGKIFVAVAILQLIEKGLLKLDSKLGDILDIDLHDIDSNITVKQLLTHTSGIPDYFDESIMENYAELWVDLPNYRIRSNKDLLPLFIDKPMMYPAGEKFQYNNTGFVVLALIIEAITKTEFDKYLNENIFKPSGMDSTGYYELDRLPARCASAYIYDDKREEYYTNIFSIDAKGTGAGGAFTTANDISRFWRALTSEKLLTKESVEEMFSPTLVECYGLGAWLKKNDNGVYNPGFMGEDPGVSCISTYLREEGIIVTLLSNFGDDVWKLKKEIVEAIEEASK